MRKIGYIRISSISQDASSQFQQLNELDIDLIYLEKTSVAAKDREQLQKMLADLRDGDIIYVTELINMVDSTEDLFEIINKFKEKKAILKSLNDTWLDLSEDNPYSEYLVTVMTGVNQLERDLLRTRQREGIELAKKEGKFKGRSKKYDKNHEGMNQAIKLYKEGNMTVNQICDITHVSRASLYRKLSEENN
ncbi:recombinase family protein [Jeotgalibacillus proteolyticus]|uniref:Resolvase n=1 Tax=Jeotgalibacillus proteolyticus TaxID=2082395 RepID=A0A2S5GE32_9BACL|nr:recombinase family protein [Jeotgalibacillus proteolyticus]PPA71171.1 resolvase [Jeotgalibacillus proteolyticus]